MSCDCRTKADAALGEHNTRVKRYFTLSDNQVGAPWSIETEQVEKGRGKKKAMGLFASFCPLCGASLKTTPPAPGSEPDALQHKHEMGPPKSGSEVRS